MAPPVSSARTQLSYPLYAADFDPFNPDFLLVAGGGGSSATGVPNKISLIDASPRDQLNEVVDIELAKDEDSVTSLAVADSSSSSLTAFAGINSTVTDQSAGKNEHLRSFKIGLPARKRRADGSTIEGEKEKPPSAQPLARAALFKPATGPKSETYQRVLRFSPSQKSGEPRIAAMATGLATDNQVIVFHPKTSPGPEDVISSVELGSREAEDLDLNANEDEKGGFALAYCTNDEVFIQQIPITSTPEKPTSLFQASQISESLPAEQRPKFRAIRFLTPRLLLLLRNKPQRSGADLIVLKVSEDCSQGRLWLRKVLNKSIKAAVSLDVSSLNESGGERQFVIAVGGIPGEKSAIEVLILDHSQDSGLGTFRSYTYLQDVHDGPLTRLVFSNFIAPATSTRDVGAQSLRLASVGVDKSVVVHRLSLRPFASNKAKPPRYVLMTPGSPDSNETAFSIVIAIFVVGFIALLTQMYCEVRGLMPPTLGTPSLFSPRIRAMLGTPYGPANVSSAAVSDVPVAAHSMTDDVRKSAGDISSTLAAAVSSATANLKHLVEQNSNLETPKAIIVREESLGDISAEAIHSDAEVIKEETLKKWEELSASQKKSWKQKLMDAGHWAEHQGENVLQGILFSEMAGVVGQMVGGA